ncbi:MAG TPA: PASTA domain-containing protein [Ilumatobacter sp.]
MSQSDPPPGDPFDPARLVDTVFAERFRVRRLVSEGANTVIFAAADDHGRAVTLKVINPSLAASPSFRERFDDTIRSVAALSHPNIAAVYDWGITPVGDTSMAYVVIEELSGGSMRDMLDRGRRLSPSQALMVGLEACRALDHAHRRGFVHTELTPSKLVFGDDRRLRLVDFGLARLLGEPVWSQPDAVPTHVAWYASPEQGLGLPVDGTTDVYALCLALHESVTGVLPFRDDSTVAALAARVGKLMPVSADLGPLAAVFERAGRPNADDRATAAEFGQGLLRAASKLPRPGPLPLLSTGLFDTPVERLREPDDPTGGVERGPLDPSPPPPLLLVPIDEPATGPLDSEPTAPVARPSSAPVVRSADRGRGGADELVILPVDSGITADPGPAPATAGPTEATFGEPAAFAGQRSAVAPTMVMPATGPAPAPAPRRAVPWKIMLAVLVVSALAVLGVLATQLFTTPVYRVPDLVGMPVAEARNLIAANDWQVTEQRERSDVVAVIGQIVRTAPAAGIDLGRGEPILIVVSEGPTLRELPESSGALFSEAQTRLVERGLDVEPLEQYDEAVPEGVVISWSVPGDPTLGPGSMVEPDTLVRLVVSLGPAPRVVPDAVGRAVIDVRVEFDTLGLVLVEGGEEFSDDVPLGAVISQDQVPGTELAKGDVVSVVVSLGPDLVVFPDLRRVASFEEAAAVLREAGFEPVLTFGDAEGEIRSYEIDGRAPKADELFERGTIVEFEAL